VWEKRDVTTAKLNEDRGPKYYWTERYWLSGHTSITTIPSYKRRQKVHIPIIIKLVNASDKNLLFKRAKNLKAFNANWRIPDEDCPYMFIWLIIWRRNFFNRKSNFQNILKILDRKERTWKAENGEYNLYIENEKFIIPENSSQNKRQSFY